MARIAVLNSAIPEDFFAEASTAPGAGHRDNGVIGEFAPAFEARETSRELRIQADLPGVLPRDVRVSLHGQRLMIWGERAAIPQSSTIHFLSYERTYGKFWRTFYLGSNYGITNARASLENGVLTLSLRKQRELPLSC